MGFLEKLEAEIIQLPTEDDYSLLRELFGIEEADVAWDYEEGKSMAIRFNNLQIFQQALTIAGSDLIEAIKENNMEKLKSTLEHIVEHLTDGPTIQLSEEDVEGYKNLADEAKQMRKQEEDYPHHEDRGLDEHWEPEI